MRRPRLKGRRSVLARMKVTLKFRRISGEIIASNPNRFRIRAEFEIILTGLRPAKITSREAEREKSACPETGGFLCAQRSAGPHRPRLRRGRETLIARKGRRGLFGQFFSSGATRGRRWSGPRRSCRSSRGRRCARGDCTSPRRPRRPRRRRRPSARRLPRRGR